MAEKDIERGSVNDEEKRHEAEPTRRGRSLSGSDTEGQLHDQHPGPPTVAKALDEGEDGSQGEPDLDHDEIEAAVPGHALDVELATGLDGGPLSRAASRASIRSRLSRIVSAVSRRSRTQAKKERIAFVPLPLTDLDQGVVGWDGQEDPAMPLNFPQRKKWVIVSLLSAITLITPFASSILAPGIGSLSAEFGNSNSTVGAMTVSIYLLGYVVGPLFLAPLSEIYGRKPVLAASNFFFCAWQVGCALAPNIAALIVFRLFSGIGGAGCLTLGAGVISDIFRVDERGFAMGIWTLGPLIGPTVGPLIGGFLAETIGWRWDFWIVLIVAVVVCVCTEIFNTETNHRVLMERKVKKLQKELGRDDLRSCYETNQQQAKSRSRILMDGLVRPTKILFRSPLVFLLSLYIAFTYGVLYLLFTTIPIIYQGVYGWSVGLTGLVYICLGLGNLSGWTVVTLQSDKTVIRMTKANGGEFQPEMRLPMCIYFGCLLPLTFFWYGWTTYYRTHWIVPILGLFPFAFGIIGLFLPIMTYLVDCYPMYAASVVAANTVFRSLVGALLPLAGPSMYDSLGLGWGNSLLGFLCVAMIPVPLLMYKYGGKLRKMEKLKL